MKAYPSQTGMTLDNCTSFGTPNHGFDTAWNQTMVCSDAYSTEMPCSGAEQQIFTLSTLGFDLATFRLQVQVQRCSEVRPDQYGCDP